MTMLSKEQEIALLRDFVASLPRNSYLADMMQGIPQEAERLILSDLAWPLSAASNLEARRHEDEALAKVRQEVRDAHTALNRVLAQVQRADDTLREIRTTARKLAAV